MDEKPFNRNFCIFLEFHLTEAFKNSTDDVLNEFWCDGVLMPHFDSQLYHKHVNDTRQIVTDAFLGPDGQGLYAMTIKFGRKALSRYARGLSLEECVPDADTTEWININVDARVIELYLK